MRTIWKVGLILAIIFVLSAITYVAWHTMEGMSGIP